jgi:hypothetical protein
MMNINSLYETCHALFTSYPLAVSGDDCDGAVGSIVLMLRDDDEGDRDGDDSDNVDFFVLSHNLGEGRSSYSLCRWPSGSGVNIGPDDGVPFPTRFANALRRGIPLPQNGSLFGWKDRDLVTALVATYTEYAPESPEPSWSVMPLEGAPETQWPPFTGEPLIGDWFWELHRAQRLVSVGGLIAGTQDTVFWADTEAIIGSDCCVVARNIRSPEGYTLQSGRYVYYRALRTGAAVPSLQALLAHKDKIDLAPRFSQSSCAGQLESVSLATST